MVAATASLADRFRALEEELFRPRRRLSALAAAPVKLPVPLVDLVFDWTDREPSPDLVWEALGRAKLYEPDTAVVLVPWLLQPQDRDLPPESRPVFAMRRPGRAQVNFRCLYQDGVPLPGVLRIAETGKVAIFIDREAAMALIPRAILAFNW